MTPKKSLEDILAEYTEDLMAERRPRLSEDIAALDENEREQLSVMLSLVRRLKAAHRKYPPPREEFVHNLDAFVREEIARHSPPASEAAGSPEVSRSVAEGRSILERMLGAGRHLIESLTLPEGRARWRLAGVALLVLVLGLQVQLYLQVWRLEQRNRSLVVRLEGLRPPGSLVPLNMPLGQQTILGKDVEKPSTRSIDELIIGIELRVRVEQRIEELEKEAAIKVGRDREVAEGVVRELRALLRPLPKP